VFPSFSSFPFLSFLLLLETTAELYPSSLSFRSRLSSFTRRPDGPKFSPDDKEKCRVFVFNEHAWWGALITGHAKKTPKGDWVYPCKLVHGKILKSVKEEKITARDQLPLIHDQVRFWFLFPFVDSFCLSFVRSFGC